MRNQKNAKPPKPYDAGSRAYKADYAKGNTKPYRLPKNFIRRKNFQRREK